MKRVLPLAVGLAALVAALVAAPPALTAPAAAPAAAPALPGITTGPVDPLRTDPVRRCAKGPQPGALALRDWLAKHVPLGRSAGIFYCRNIRGGTSLSLHAAGRAVDWKLNAAKPRQKRAANRLVAALLAARDGEQWVLARRMGLQEIIWNGEIWTAERAAEGWRTYRPGAGGSLHTDHVHLGMNVPGSRKRTSFWR